MTKEEIYQDFIQSSRHLDETDLTFPSPSQSPSTRSSCTQEQQQTAETPPTPSELSFISLKEEPGEAKKEELLNDDVARRIRDQISSKALEGEEDASDGNEVYFSFYEGKEEGDNDGDAKDK